MESESEEITPLKRRRKKKDKVGCFDADSNKQYSTSINTTTTTTTATTTTTTAQNENKLTPTKKNSTPTKKNSIKITNIYESSPNKELLSCTVNNTTSTKANTENLLSFKGVFCSANNKPDMMFFKPRSCENAVKDKLIHCPICQINLQFLHGTTSQCHINQCLDMQPDFEQGLFVLH